MVLPVVTVTLNWTLYISWTLSDVSYFHRKLTMQVRIQACEDGFQLSAASLSIARLAIVFQNE